MEDLKTLQKKVLKVKKDLKEWEAIFLQKHGRPATIQDISERPKIEKFYRKYNRLKRQLKAETAQSQEREQADSQCSLPSVSQDSQTPASTSQSPERGRRRSSVEFVRSPSHPLGSRIKPSIFESKQQQINVRRLSEFEEMKSALAASNNNSKPAVLKKTLTEDEAFWLDLPPSTTTTSYSQPTAKTSTSSSFHFSQEAQTQPSPRLILGSSQPKRKKNFKQQKLFGRNPFQRASSSQDLLHPLEDTSSSLPPIPPSPQLSQPSQQPFYRPAMIPDDEDEDDEMIEVVTHEIDPFRKYDPSLFHWEDPTFSIGPGFFSSVSPCFTTPILNDPTRRDRVLRKLEKGTLGEVLEENQNMELDMDEDIRDFLSTQLQIDSIESALQPIDENLLQQKEYVYKKKPLQKRQTKLHKMRFVDTAS